MIALLGIFSIFLGLAVGEPYYGILIGQFEQSKVYAGDSRTLTIVSEEARTPEDVQCTSFIGSLQDSTGSSSNGLRVKRQGFAMNNGQFVPQLQAQNPNHHPLDFGFELAHLKVEDEESASDSSPDAKGPIQDPFDVELSKDTDEPEQPEDQNQNVTKPVLTVSPDSDATTADLALIALADASTTPVPVTGTPSGSTAGIVSASASIAEVDELSTSIVGPRLTLPAVRVTTPLPDGQVGSTPEPQVLTAIVLQSSVTAAELPETNVTATPPPVGTTQDATTEDDEESEPPPISTGAESPSSPEVAETSSTEEATEAVTPPPSRKALWSRPTVAASESATDGTEGTEATAAPTESAKTSPEVTEGTAGSTEGAKTTLEGTSSATVEIEPVLGSKEMEDIDGQKVPTDGASSATTSLGTERTRGRTKASQDSRSKPTKQPTHTNAKIGSGISWGDQPAKPISSNGQQESSNSGGVIYLGNGPAAAPNDGRGAPPPAEAGQGRPGKKTNGRPVSILRALPVEYIGGLNVPDELEGKQNATEEGSRAAGEVQGVKSDPDAVYTIQFGGSHKPSTPSIAPPQEPTSTQSASFRGLPPSPPAAPAAPAAAGPPGSPQAPGAAASAAAVPVPVPDATAPPPVIAAAPEATDNSTGKPFGDTVGDSSDCGGKAWCVVPDPHQRRTLSPESATTAPPTVPQGGDGQWYYVEDRHTQLRAGVPADAAAAPSNSTPPITTRRLKKRDASGKISHKKPYQKAHKDEAQRTDHLFNGAKRGNQVYLVPQVTNGKTILRLPIDYQLQDFESIKIYDHCKRVRTANVKTSEVKTPKELELPGFHGYQYDIKSAQTRVLNCNSLLVKNFTYHGAGKIDAHFYVGDGAYPFSIGKKYQASVIGESANQSLNNYSNQDVLIRLPTGVRTMDVTWMGVQTKDGIALAHVIIPPANVPPCE